MRTPSPARPDRLVFGRANLLFAALGAVLVAAVLLLGFGVGLRWIADATRRAGLSEDTGPVSLRIGREALAIPANLIRFADQRRGGEQPRVDLQLVWPELEGYSPAAVEAFADPAGGRIVHLSLAPREAAFDEAMRLRAVYSRLFAGEPRQDPVGLTVRRFAEGSGYDGEEVYYGSGPAPFVARCPAGDGPDFTTCQREVHAGTGLSVTQRFPKALLGDWRALDARLHDLVERLRGAPGG